MTWLRRAFLLALVGSLVIHLAAVAMTLKPRPGIKIEGSGQIQNAVLGSSPFNTVMAGSTEETANAEPANVEPLEARKVTESHQAQKPDTVAPSESQKSEPVQPAIISHTVTTVSRQQIQPPLKLHASAQNALAVRSVDETLERPAVEEAVSPIKAETPTKPPAQSQTSVSPVKAKQIDRTSPKKNVPASSIEPVTRPLPASSQTPVKPTSEKPENASREETVEPEGSEQPAAETAKPVAPDQEFQEVASNIPPPPVKPKTRQKQVTEKASASKPVKKAQAQRKEKSKGTARRTSRSGAGGKSNSTAEKGGSQRKGNGKTAGNSNVTNYPAKVRHKLYRSVRKPRSGAPARKDAVVKFTVRKNGSVSGISLVRTSGSKAVDRAVLKAVQRAAPFPPIPAEARRNNWSFSIPVRLR